MARKILKVERVTGDGGLRVVMGDGAVISYRSVADLPGDVAALLARMDAAGDGQEPQGDAEAAQAAYQQRLESAWQQGQTRTNPGDGLTGQAAYVARLESGWQQDTRKPKLPRPKHWRGS